MSAEQTEHVNGPLVELPEELAGVFSAMAIELAQAMNERKVVIMLVDGEPVHVHMCSPTFEDTFRVISDAYEACLAHQIAQSPAGMIQ